MEISRGASDRPHRALLQHPEQFHLHGQRHFADFVEEDGAAAGHFEESALVLIGSCESSLQIAEELALQQSFREGSAIYRDERFSGARRADVDSAGHQFFTGTALAVNQNRAGSGSDCAEGLLQLLHRGAGADDVVERVVRSSVAAQGEVLLA
jgi:hypothetical protein